MRPSQFAEGVIFVGGPFTTKGSFDTLETSGLAEAVTRLELSSLVAALARLELSGLDALYLCLES
jgi:hypothetical protein